MESKELKNEIIVGKNAVTEALKSDLQIDKLYCVKDKLRGISDILRRCRDKNIPIKEVSSEKISFLAPSQNHQGVAVTIAAFKYAESEDVFALAKRKNEDLFIVICDQIEDPHNLGAIIRTAEVMGAHGVFIPKRHNASLTATVARASAGALMHIPVVRVQNISAVIEELKMDNVWIYGLDMGGDSIYQTDFSGKVGLVVGSEGKGLGRLIKEKCDFLVKIPMHGKINSLNASVAAGIVMSEVAKIRNI